MDYLIWIVVIVVFVLLFSSKKQDDTARALACIDLCKTWFVENKLKFNKAKFSSFPTGSGVTTLIGITRDNKGNHRGFAISIDHVYGAKPDGIIIPPVVAANANTLVMKANKARIPIVDFIRYNGLA